MLTAYLTAAVAHADYEDLSDEGWYGHIPGFSGLWANAPTLDDCRDELRSSLEDWLPVGLRLGHTLPVVDGIDLKVKRVA